MSATMTFDTKELRDLQRRFRKGFTLEKGGDKHFRIRDPEGNLVRNRKGTLLSVPSTPSRGVGKTLLLDLREAGVLDEGVSKAKPRLTREQQREKQELSERKQREIATRSANRAKEGKALRDKLTKVIDPVGGWGIEGMLADLAFMGAAIAREQGQDGMTPDLFQPALTRVKQGDWVTPRYSEVLTTLAERLEVAQAQGNLHAEFFRMLRESRGLPSESIVPRAKLNGAGPEEWPFEVERIPVDRCMLDHTYQRPAVWMFIRKIARSFDPTLVGTIDVSERRQGAAYAILDGQLRFEAMKLVGKTTVWASIYSDLDHQAEARFFLHKNKDRKAVHPFYTFRAQIIAGDAHWKQIDEIVRSVGYEIALTSATVTDENHISAIQACEDAFERSTDHRPECLTPTLRLLRETTLGRRNGQAAQLLRGLGRFFELYDDDQFEWDRLREVVADRGPEWIIGRAREESRSAGGAMGLWVTRVVVGEYNRGMSRKLRRP